MEPNGGVFPAEAPVPAENGYFEAICPPEGEVRFMMSGRCGIFLCLEDLRLTDEKKVAYVPRYTCETVLAPFAKAGYELMFYDVDERLHSIFDPAALDRISVISLCGYFGFCSYDREFVRSCRERGVAVFEDVTHSLFSVDGIDPLCDYAAGSFRKWMGVPCGGFAVKRKGRFGVPSLPVHQRHLELRRRYIEEGGDVFWEGERLLRQIFDRYAGDPESERLMRQADLDRLRRIRRENYALLLEQIPADPTGFRPVFPVLTGDAVPCNFPVYADDRERFREFLAQQGVRTTVYWPVGPLVDLEGHETVRYIYDHIVSIPCGQLLDADAMRRTAQAMNSYSCSLRKNG